MSADFHFENHGSITLLLPLTEPAKDWLAEHIPDDAQWFGKALVIEPRYVADILTGLQNDGLTVN